MTDKFQDQKSTYNQCEFGTIRFNSYNSMYLLVKVKVKKGKGCPEEEHNTKKSSPVSPHPRGPEYANHFLLLDETDFQRQHLL